MFQPVAHTALALDVSTLFIVVTCLTALLGLFLLFVWVQDRVRALAWWGSAYLIGAFSVAAWNIESLNALPVGTPNALLFIACGMMWNAARLFHGRPVLWGALAAGATVWLLACTSAEFVGSIAARICLSSLTISVYTFLTAAELWRERRRRLRRWPALFVPMLHGAVFLFPIPIASLVPSDGGMLTLASGWVALFALETMLYIVGTAFIVLVLTKERTVGIHKAAAATDPLTGLFNRRGFMEAAQQMMERKARRGEPVTLLAFDLDHFKSINDKFGHAVGDQALLLFAATVGSTLRASDILARFGGEEFIALLPDAVPEATIAANRVRLAFEAAGRMVGEHPIGATVSIGVAGGDASVDINTLLGSADAMLYRAKQNGRNRVETELTPEPMAAPDLPVPIAAAEVAEPEPDLAEGARAAA